jgi:hypothetical protein
LLSLALMLCWPVPVLRRDPNAWGVWMTEIGQKTGILPIAHRQRALLGLELPLLALPWPVLALAGVALPLVGRGRVRLAWNASSVWFPWWWVVGNLAVVTGWAVAKPNYFVPCLPGLALLVGMAWIRLCRVAGSPARSVSATLARCLLQAQWLVLFLVGILSPLLSRSYLPAAPVPWLVVISGSATCGMAVGWWLWRRDGDRLALLPVTAACALGVLIGYGVIAPTGNGARGHRLAARQLESLVPSDVQTLRFFHELDEGLWFYLRDHRLAPVPGSQPRYSDSYDRLGQLLRKEPPSSWRQADSLTPQDRDKHHLLEWLGRRSRIEPYLLIRAAWYDLMAPDLSGLVTPVYREVGLDRAPLVLLQAREEHALSARPIRDGRALR